MNKIYEEKHLQGVLMLINFKLSFVLIHLIKDSQNLEHQPQSRAKSDFSDN